MIKCCLGAEKRIYDFEDGLATLGHLKWVFETLSSVECMLKKLFKLISCLNMIPKRLNINSFPFIKHTTARYNRKYQQMYLNSANNQHTMQAASLQSPSAVSLNMQNQEIKNNELCEKNTKCKK